MATHNPLPIFAFGNMRFARIAENWVVHILKCKIHEFEIFCHDTELQSFLRSRFPEHTEKFIFNADTVFDINPERITQYFQFRKVLFHKLLIEHSEYIFSDLDAIGLSDVRNSFREPGADFVLQKVTHFKALPSHVRKKIGFTVCMGLWYVKNTQSVIKLFEDFINDNEPDDQKSMNDILFGRVEVKILEGDRKPKYWNAHNVSCAALSEDLMQRPFYRRHYRRQILNPNGIVHPVVKKGMDPVYVLQKYDLWSPKTATNIKWSIISTAYQKYKKIRFFIFAS